MPLNTQKDSLVASLDNCTFRLAICPSNWSTAPDLYAASNGETSDFNSGSEKRTLNNTSYSWLRKASTCGKSEYLPFSYLDQK